MYLRSHASRACSCEYRPQVKADFARIVHKMAATSLLELRDADIEARSTGEAGHDRVAQVADQRAQLLNVVSTKMQVKPKPLKAHDCSLRPLSCTVSLHALRQMTSTKGMVREP